MSIVVKARRTEKGITIHELDNGEIRQYIAVRAGLNWPLMKMKLPAYYCIVGEELVSAAERKGNRRGRLILLSEYETPDILTSLPSFFMKLTDDSRLYLCETFYTVIEEFQGEDYRGYVEALQKFVYGKEATVTLEQAPWADKPDLGMYHIKSWMDKSLLDLSKGILLQNQLRMIETDKVDLIPQMFNAVNALRFVVYSFEKDKPILIDKDWRKKMPRTTWRSV
jgi:hypothetical protein